jgi:hypothetical protein
MSDELPPTAQQELKNFLVSGKPGSITFHSDGHVIQQTDVKLITKERPS